MEVVEGGISLMNEQELIVAAQGGDTKAFDTLVQECLPKLKTLLFKHYHLQSTDMDDVIQVAANKAWTKLANFRGDSTFLTWFYTIIRNETMNFVKKRNVIESKEVPAHFSDELESEDYEHILRSSIDQKIEETAESIMERQETLATYKQIIEDVLKKLNPIHREIIEMVLQEEMSYKDISEKLNIPIGTVMSRLFFARKHAQKLIQQHASRSDIDLSCIAK